MSTPHRTFITLHTLWASLGHVEACCNIMATKAHASFHNENMPSIDLGKIQQLQNQSFISDSSM